MAGDLEIGPTLKKACINTITDNINIYMTKYASKQDATAPPSGSVPDGGISGSVMIDTYSAGDSRESMECESSCMAALEIDSQKCFSDLGHSDKMMKNIESLDETCHHTPPCGSQVRKKRKKSADTFFIPNPISEEILKNVCKKGRLDNATAEFFSDPQKFRIKRAYLKKAGHITASGLRTLFSKHVLTEVHAPNINVRRTDSPLPMNPDRKRITIGDVVSCMNSATRENLKILNVSGIPSEKDDLAPLAIYVSIGQFKKLSILVNVQSLNVSHTNFTDNDLNTVIACMKNLRSLDISKTYVRSILYLGDTHAPKLASLSMNNLERLNMPKESLFDVFCKMTELQHLDISTETKATTYRSMVPPNDQNISRAIVMVMVGGGYPLPKLRSLDISGREGIEEVMFLNFYDTHPQLRFLGLLHTQLDGLPHFVDEKSPNFNHRIKVTGDRTEAQIMESLTRYYQRPFFAKDALFSLFNHTQLLPQYSKEQLELVLRCMRNHRSGSEISYTVQLAASACLYNLTNREIGVRIPTDILSKVASETLVTMEQNKDKKRLQQNCLMIICNDRLLKDVTFDYFKTATLVMQCLCTIQDNTMHRMAVAIISILAAKISTQQTSILGSSENVKVLLHIVDSKLSAAEPDLTLKFTLSSLWNLTDESPSTCLNFIENNGLDLIVRVLSAHVDSPCVQTKVLGLLNNLAEVPSLRHHLLKHDIVLIEAVQKLLHSKHIEVCYFAAGVISHLAILGANEWNESLRVPGKREEFLNDLYSCVMSWKPPQGEMVAYRTFKPFFPLLRTHDTPAMQLWAAWAIKHVCLKNGEKYQQMLVEEGGVDCLLQVRENPVLDPNVNNLIELTLEIIDQSYPHLGILQGRKM